MLFARHYRLSQVCPLDLLNRPPHHLSHRLRIPRQAYKDSSPRIRRDGRDEDTMPRVPWKKPLQTGSRLSRISSRQSSTQKLLGHLAPLLERRRETNETPREFKRLRDYNKRLRQQ